METIWLAIGISGITMSIVGLILAVINFIQFNEAMRRLRELEEREPEAPAKTIRKKIWSRPPGKELEEPSVKDTFIREADRWDEGINRDDV